MTEIVEWAKGYTIDALRLTGRMHALALAELPDQSGVMVVPIHAGGDVVDPEVLKAWALTALALARCEAGDESRAVAVVIHGVGLPPEQVEGDLTADPRAEKLAVVLYATHDRASESHWTRLGVADDGQMYQVEPRWVSQPVTPFEASIVDPVLNTDYHTMPGYADNVRQAAELMGFEAVFDFPYEREE